MNHVGLNSKCWVKYKFLIVPYMPMHVIGAMVEQQVRTPGLRPEGSGFKSGTCTFPTVNLLESLSDLSLEHV